MIAEPMPPVSRATEVRSEPIVSGSKRGYDATADTAAGAVVDLICPGSFTICGAIAVAAA
jgi:hypothetical protein